MSLDFPRNQGHIGAGREYELPGQQWTGERLEWQVGKLNADTRRTQKSGMRLRVHVAARYGKQHSRIRGLVQMRRPLTILAFTHFNQLHTGTMSYKSYTQPVVDSNKIFKDDIFEGKVLFCTGGGSGICRGMTEAVVRIYRFILGSSCAISTIQTFHRCATVPMRLLLDGSKPSYFVRLC